MPTQGLSPHAHSGPKPTTPQHCHAQDLNPHAQGLNPTPPTHTPTCGVIRGLHGGLEWAGGGERGSGQAESVVRTCVRV